MSSSPLDAKKAMPTLDEMIDQRMQAILDTINTHFSKVYNDFNDAMIKQDQKSTKVEADLSQALQVLWGIMNQASARSAALESVLIKNGLNPEELATELDVIVTKMKDSGAWIEMPLEAMLKEGETPPPTPKNPTQRL